MKLEPLKDHPVSFIPHNELHAYFPIEFSFDGEHCHQDGLSGPEVRDAGILYITDHGPDDGDPDDIYQAMSVYRIDLRDLVYWSIEAIWSGPGVVDPDRDRILTAMAELFEGQALMLRKALAQPNALPERTP